MPSLCSVATFVALVGLTVASPVDVLQKRGSFTINQVEGRRVIKSGAVAMRRGLRKWGVPISRELESAASRVGVNGSVVTTPEQYDVEYLAPVSIGDHQLNLDFDTGSSDLWVFSSAQPKQDLVNHRVYQVNPANLVKGASWTIRYGDNSGAAGFVYSETVKVGGVTATRQAVEAASSVSTAFLEDQANDGLLGLGFSQLNQVRPVAQKTFFDTVKADLAKPVFTASLKKGAPGSYDFGSIDPSKYTGSITYTPVDSTQGHWQFTTTSIAIGNGAAVPFSSDSIADTGTSLWYVPEAIAEAYYAKVPGSRNDILQGGYVFPCTAQLPDVTVVIGGTKHVVAGKFINYAPGGVGTCFGGLQTSSGLPFSIFGDVFLKSQFVVFDSGDNGVPRIGFAQQA